MEESFTIRFGDRIDGASTALEFNEFAREAGEAAARAESQTELEKLDAETQKTKLQVQDNLESIVKRGASLNRMEDDSVELVNGTKDILASAKELDMAAFWRRYAIWVILGGVACLWLLFKVL